MHYTCQLKEKLCTFPHYDHKHHITHNFYCYLITKSTRVLFNLWMEMHLRLMISHSVYGRVYSLPWVIAI